MNRTGIVTGWRGDGKPQRAQVLRRQMTPQEKLLWQNLRGNHLDNLHFRRQVTIDGFIADFYCHEVGIVLEVDGAVHRNQQEYDKLRDQIIAARGLRILRFTNHEVETKMTAVLSRIREAVKKRDSP